MSEHGDPEELLARIENLEAAVADLQAYGETHDIPVVERTATRIDGTVATLYGNVPGGLEE